MKQREYRAEMARRREARKERKAARYRGRWRRGEDATEVSEHAQEGEER